MSVSRPRRVVVRKVAEQQLCQHSTVGSVRLVSLAIIIAPTREIVCYDHSVFKKEADIEREKAAYA
jgi:hypothetical protein